MRRLFGLGSILIVAIALVVGVVFRQDIYDWYVLRNYHPPAEIVNLARDASMTDYGKRLLYINRPVISDKEEFNKHCRDNDHSIVLGCYISGQQGIYLLDVKDERLEGVKEVTAAHEMLHAAYERLSLSERGRVDALLSEAFKDVDSTRIKESIEQYRKQNPDIVANELHSILGAEVRNLPSELEQYYKKYFINRDKVVTLSEQYEQVFLDIRNAIREYDSTLATMKDEIESLSQSLNEENMQIATEREELNALRRSDVEAYNLRVSSYNTRVTKYNGRVNRLSSLVEKYNETVQLRNSVASEEDSLVQAIDSRAVVPNQR